MSKSLPVVLLTSLLTACIQEANVGKPDPPAVVDLDEDLTIDSEDCDDGDPLVYPGATEVCDGRDNNCDGLIDGIRSGADGTEAVQVCAREQTFNQDMRLDLLFVVDNSVSMLDAQERVADGVGDLLAWVIGVGLDTHVGAITTDMDDPLARGKLIQVAGTSFADGSLPISVEEWASEAIVVGIDGSPEERPFDAILTALAPTTNPGFRRSDAHLAVVVLTDEDDQSEATPQQFVEGLRSLSGPRGASFHGLVSDEEGCDEVVSENILAVISASDGLLGSICSSDYGGFLSPVGQVAAQRALNARFLLDSPAQLGSITVKVHYPGGIVDALDPGVDFALTADGRGLTLLQNLPPAGSRLTVSWLAQPGSVE